MVNEKIHASSLHFDQSCPILFASLASTCTVDRLLSAMPAAQPRPDDRLATVPPLSAASACHPDAATPCFRRRCIFASTQLERVVQESRRNSRHRRRLWHRLQSWKRVYLPKMLDVDIISKLHNP